MKICQRDFLIENTPYFIFFMRMGVSYYSSGLLEGGGPSSADVIEDTEDLNQFYRFFH